MSNLNSRDTLKVPNPVTGEPVGKIPKTPEALASSGSVWGWDCQMEFPNPRGPFVSRAFGGVSGAALFSTARTLDMLQTYLPLPLKVEMITGKLPWGHFETSIAAMIHVASAKAFGDCCGLRGVVENKGI